MFQFRYEIKRNYYNNNSVYLQEMTVNYIFAIHHLQLTIRLPTTYQLNKFAQII
jgi:hypothetical protein